jgi:hypothetical protein
MISPRLSAVFSKLAALSCLICPAVMVITDIITILLNRNANPLEQSISGYAAGPYGWLEKLGMVLIAVSFFAITVNALVAKNKKELHRLRLVGELLVIVGVGFLMLSIFNTNVFGTLMSFHGLIHQFTSAAVSIVFYTACLLVMRLMINKAGLRYYAIYSGLTFLVGLVVLILLVFKIQHNNYMGLMERMIAGFNLVWIILVGPQLIKLAGSLQ